MSNQNVVTPYASSTGLTVGQVTTFFPDTDVPAVAVIAEATVTLALETLTAQTIPLVLANDPQMQGLKWAVVGVRAICTKGISFTSGTNPAITAQVKVDSNAATAATALEYSTHNPLVAGQCLNITSAPQSTAPNTGSGQNALNLVLALSGSPTNASGVLKFLLDLIVVP